MSKITSTDSDGTHTDSYIYNSKGAVVKILSTDNKKTNKTNYTITAYDSKGNWLERKSKTPENKLFEETRRIEYW